MEHKGTVTIKTARLLLRKFKLDDIAAAFKNRTSDYKVTEFFAGMCTGKRQTELNYSTILKILIQARL